MKKIVMLLVIFMMALMPTMAQETLPMAVRNGNTYWVENTKMHKQAFKGYLQNTNPAAFAKFKSGLSCANAGWALFATSFGMDIAGVAMVAASGFQPNEGAIAGLALGGTALLYTSGAVLTASIVCLGVGYGRMHNACDLYNVSRNQPQAYISLNAGANGLGLALHF